MLKKARARLTAQSCRQALPLLREEPRVPYLYLLYVCARLGSAVDHKNKEFYAQFLYVHEFEEQEEGRRRGPFDVSILWVPTFQRGTLVKNGPRQSKDNGTCHIVVASRGRGPERRRP